MSYPFRVTSPIVFIFLLFFCSTLLFLPFTSIIPVFPPPRLSGLCLALGREGPELTQLVIRHVPYILCVYGPNIVVLGARCSQPSSSWSPPQKSCFGRLPTQYRSGTSQSVFSKPLHFWIPAFLVNILLKRTPKKILDRMKLQDSKRVHLYAGGAQNGRFCPCPFHDLFCLCSSSGLPQDV